MRKWGKGKATVALLMLVISVVCVAPTSFSGMVQAQTLTLHLVIGSEDIGAHSEIASSVETELAKIGIDVIIDPRDNATLADTVWGEYWNKTWDEEPGNGWDMAWYEFPHPKSWALIISGSTGGSFSNNTEYMYHMLNQSYNFDGIYYLDVDTSRPGVNASATIDNVRQAITGWLDSHSGINDMIFIYFTSHGCGYHSIIGFGPFIFHTTYYSMGGHGRVSFETFDENQAREVNESHFRLTGCPRILVYYDLDDDGVHDDFYWDHDNDERIEMIIDNGGNLSDGGELPYIDVDGDGNDDDLFADINSNNQTDILINAGNWTSDGEDGNNDGIIIGVDFNGNGGFNDWIGIDECMQVQDGWYWDDDLESDLNELDYAKLIFVRQGCIEGDEGCFGGGLIDDISAPNRIIMTATNETWHSYGDWDEDGYSEWSEAFIDALHGERTHYDNGVIHESPPILVDADTNNDSYVSMLEAWDYAWDHDDARLIGWETPWLDDNGNGLPTYKEEQDVLDTTDRELASRTYLKRDLGIHFYSWATPPNGGYNIMGLNSTASDRFLIGGMNRTYPVEAVKAYFDAWQKEWMHDPPAVIIYYPPPYQCARGIAFNLHHPVLRNRYVRQAIAHAIPYSGIFKNLGDHWDIKNLIPGRAAVLPSHYYEGKQLWNTEIKPYTYNIAKAQKYLDMWRYAQTGTDGTKGPAGDADFDGFVDLDDLLYWYEEFGNAPYDIPYAPYTIDADFDNSGTVGAEDFGPWLANFGEEYPFYGASPFESSSSPESPEEPPAMPTESEGPYVKVYVDQPLGYIPGQSPHRTVTVDIIIEVTNITDNSAEGIVGWGMDIQVDPDVLEFYRATGSTNGYFLYEFADWYWYDYPTLLQGDKNSTTGYWNELTEIIMPLPQWGAGNGTSYPTSSNLLITLEFTSKSKPKYSLIDLINVEWLDTYNVWHPVNEIIDGHYNPPPT